ncbi:SDR family NAD(P)-dependent oxidoreductase [Marinomonas aquiplantarum]|uniref:NAD(P)-dependent dehydrogenase (Short-subunit alcohol dehydrogenase family) n=1 Tax=Marinomonas aquiplantarum TaxID=491951 RepID=A0A366D3Y6_9GAMM|nr:SDR family NAD(P)-dependent oxidoreductase [Marinomonas aquiplantarum]RBO84783.1 NAD(P)-dependent dehydrogenase (short-subunit alcohol dehydrogenase family) [Marinomonas aquiplantarum]
MSTFHGLVIGASSAIGQAIIEMLEQDPACSGITAVSRGANSQLNTSKVHSLACDYQQESIEQVCQELMAWQGHIHKVFICNGILHDDTMQPERKIESVNAAQMAASFQANSITPMLWLKSLLPVLKGTTATQVAVFSARVGSISDNKMGGWYSYRASKAALNMLIQTSAVEYARRAKNVKLIAFHPGTTDTPLSQPFQRSVPEGKLFTPSFVAQQLLNLMNNIPMDNQAAYMDWNHQAIDW